MIKRKVATFVLLVLGLVVMGDEVLTRSTAALQSGATKGESQAKALNPKGQSRLTTVTSMAQNEGGRKSERDRTHQRGAAAVSMIDLKKIDRTIRKEPTYRTKPRYALLVLGQKAETRVWLVIDGKTLYVDRNGNGDLTEEGEHISAAKTNTPNYLEFYAGAFVEADGKTKHSNLYVNQYFHQKLGYLVNGMAVMDVLDVGSQGTNAEEGCSFAATPKDAPVIHIGGPLVMKTHSLVVDGPGGSRAKGSPFELRAGERLSELHVQVGTPGLGKGTFASFGVEKGFPADLHPIAELVVPSKTDPDKTINMQFSLKERC